MSLVGAVSLTNKEEGLFLGKVNIDNLNINPNNIVYSSDGINLEGLNIGAGLQKVLDEIETVGNPSIQLVSNSLYVNDNVNTIQSKIDEATQADVIYISSGSYNESLLISNKYNISINGPETGGTICEVLNGFTIENTSELIRLVNLSIKLSTPASSTIIAPIGRCVFKNVVFTGSSSLLLHVINIGNSTTKYMTFINCEFNNFCVININSSLQAPIYFINCNFGGATINYGNLSPLLVIMNNCNGLIGFPTSSQATMFGLCVTVNGISNTQTTLINGSSYPPATIGVSVNNQAQYRIPFCSATTNVLDTNPNVIVASDGTLTAQNIEATNNVDTVRINNKLVANITDQFENGICVSLGNENSMVNYAGLSYTESTATLNTPNLNVSNINGSPYTGGGSVAGFQKLIYYQKSGLSNQTGNTLGYTTDTALTLDGNKFYIVNISYTFNCGTGQDTQLLQAAIRDNNDTTYTDAQFTAGRQQQMINLTFYFQPQMSPTNLTFLISGPDHQINNTTNDIIIWTINEIQ